MKRVNMQENTDGKKKKQQQRHADEEREKTDRELCCSHVLEEKYTVTRENETGSVNFLHMCAACNTAS